MQRRRSVSHTFEENIAAEKAKLEAQIVKLKPGHQMDALRKKIRQLDTASHISDWLCRRDCSLQGRDRRKGGDPPMTVFIYVDTSKEVGDPIISRSLQCRRRGGLVCGKRSRRRCLWVQRPRSERGRQLRQVYAGFGAFMARSTSPQARLNVGVIGRTSRTWSCPLPGRGSAQPQPHPCGVFRLKLDSLSRTCAACLC